MEERILKAEYDETFLKTIIAEVNWLLVYWNISEKYNKRFTKRYGEKFFEDTKEILKIKNLSNNTEEIVEIKEPTNNYYVKFNYSDSIYQVQLMRLGKNNNEDYGYILKSNKIHSPNVKIRINEYDASKVRFKNLETGDKSSKTHFFNSKDFPREYVEKFYEDIIKPSWNAYKKENGYKEK